MKHWYAKFERGGKLWDVLRFESKEERDFECLPCNQTSRSRLSPILAAQAAPLTRELYGLDAWERFYGNFAWVGCYSPTVGSKCEHIDLITH